MAKKRTAKTQKTVSKRILALSLIILGLFAVLLARLIWLQVIENRAYTEKKDDYTSVRQYNSPPRGQIYDRNGKVLAKTVVSHNFVYTSPQGMSYDDYEFYADRIVHVFDMDPDQFSTRDKQEAYMTWTGWLDPEDERYQARNLLSAAQRELLDSGEMSESERYAALMKKIGDEQISEMSDEDLAKAVIYQRMTSNIAAGQESVILEDVSDADAAYLVEHKTEFPGFDVDFGGWKREYPYGETLSDVIGTVSSSTEGLPADKLEYYTARGYQLNAPVGKSGLELQYNDLLAGREEISLVTYNSNGLAQTEVIQQAQKGYDIVISIDIELQQTMDDVVKSTLQSNAGTRRRENFSSLFMCMMEPENGSLLALSGYQMDLETRKLTYFASGNYTSLVNPGSSIKGATVYMGLTEGVVQPQETIMDEVMNIGGEEFGSFNNYGAVDARRALSVSSNVYMFNIAIRLAGGSYVNGQPLSLPNAQETFVKMRQYYSMFGLGNATGLDIPGEVDSYVGVGSNPGLLLNFAIGQFDMCTPVQLMQYISVIAEDGRMYEPHFFQYAQEVNSEEVVDMKTKNLKNTVPEGTEDNIKVVQDGMRACVTDGNCGEKLKNLEQPMAAKTGTAEVGDWTTANLVGYGPVDDPKVSFACSAPLSSVNSKDVAPNICGSDVVPPVLEKYFELYPVK